MSPSENQLVIGIVVFDLTKRKGIAGLDLCWFTLSQLTFQIEMF